MTDDGEENEGEDETIQETNEDSLERGEGEDEEFEDGHEIGEDYMRTQKIPVIPKLDQDGYRPKTKAQQR